MAALSRMADGTHRKITIGAGDTVIFSSHPIPGNEKPVTRIINQLLQKGVNVVFQDVHVSGHACQEEIKLIYSLVQPKFSVPVHGEYKHLMAQAKIARDLGFSKDRIRLLSSGDVLELTPDSAEVNGKVPVGDILVDGSGIGDVGNVVLRDRQRLAADGIIIVCMAITSEGQLVSGPDVVSRGFVYIKESEDLIAEAAAVAQSTVENCLDDGADWNAIKTAVRDVLGDFVWKNLKRKPMILPIIEEV
jgi:ribonuclease J